MAAPTTILVLLSLLYLASSKSTPQMGFTSRIIHSSSAQTHHNLIHPTSENGHTTAPVEYTLGAYLMPLAIGSPAVQRLLNIDTASSLTWVQCEPCQQCPTKISKPFNPSESTTFEELFITFHTLYGDGDKVTGELDKVTGELVSDKISIPSPNTNKPHHELNYIDFGCVHSYSSVLVANRETEDGILALGRGINSILNQVPIDRFSCCFNPPERLGGQGFIKFGTDADILGGSTLLVEVPKREDYYYVNLEGLSIGDSSVPLPEGFFKVRSDGSGGFYIDTGTVLSSLHESIYRPLESLIDRVVGEESRVKEGDVSPYETCYWMSDSDLESVKLTYHFFGGLNVTVFNTGLFVEAFEDVLCLNIVPFPSNSQASVLGSLGQIDLNVGLDLVGGTVSMFPTICQSTLHE